MSIILQFNNLQIPHLREKIEKRSYVAIIGSRTIKDDKAKMLFIYRLAKDLYYNHDCKITTGGAYGPDQVAMEGALDIPQFSLNPIIPLTSKKINKTVFLIEQLTGFKPFIDKKEGSCITKSLIVFYPDFTTGYHPGKYIERDYKIVNLADVILAFWDGKSRGTKKTIDYALKQGKENFVII